MRKHIRLSILSCVTLLAICSIASAQERGPYFKFGLGPSFTEDVKINEFFGATDLGSIDLDPGVRMDLGFGYQFEPWIAAEFETGFIYNSIDRFGSGNRIQDFGDSSLGSWPLMANVVFTIPIPNSRLVPFAGAGAGGVVTWLDLDEVYIPEADIFIDGYESEIVFAWQGFAGLRYIFNEHFDITLSYKYLHAQSTDWDVEPVFFGDPFERISLGQTHNHSVIIGATWRF